MTELAIYARCSGYEGPVVYVIPAAFGGPDRRHSGMNWVLNVGVYGDESSVTVLDLYTSFYTALERVLHLDRVKEELLAQR
jgi:hypothetical protein